MATASVVNRRELLKTNAAGGAALVAGLYLPSDSFGEQEQEKNTPNPFSTTTK